MICGPTGGWCGLRVRFSELQGRLDAVDRAVRVSLHTGPRRRALQLAQDERNHLSTRVWSRARSRVPPPTLRPHVHLQTATHREVLEPFVGDGGGRPRSTGRRRRKTDPRPRRPDARRRQKQAHGGPPAPRRALHAAHVALEARLRIQRRERADAASATLYAIDARRVHQTRSWAVSFWILRPFGPTCRHHASSQHRSRS